MYNVLRATEETLKPYYKTMEEMYTIECTSSTVHNGRESSGLSSHLSITIKSFIEYRRRQNLHVVERRGDSGYGIGRRNLGRRRHTREVMKSCTVHDKGIKTFCALSVLMT